MKFAQIVLATALITMTPLFWGFLFVGALDAWDLFAWVRSVDPFSGWLGFLFHVWMNALIAFIWGWIVVQSLRRGGWVWNLEEVFG
jgi:hypothetical protein